MQAFYMARDGMQYGPFEEARFRELIAEKRLVGTDLVWFPRLEHWRPAAEVLGDWFRPAVPTPPPLPPHVKTAASRPAETLPFAKLRQGNVPQPAAPSAAAASSSRPAATPAPANPWMKRIESTKSVIGADKLVDPRQLSEAFTKTFLARESEPAGETDLAPHDSDSDHEDGEHDDGHEDDQDDLRDRW